MSDQIKSGNPGSGQRKPRVASIGGGMIGQVHARSAKKAANCDYIALCDANPARRALADELGIKFYTDYHEMIQKENLDGVIIALPNDMHRESGCYCAGQGLHIMMEKPIASDVDDAKAIVESASKNSIRLIVAHHRRFNPLIEETRNIIQRGELGKIVGINILWCMYKPDEYFETGTWRRQKGGGPLLINTIHEVDVLRYVYGEVGRVYAELSNKIRGFEVEDTVSISLRFKDGTPASILMSDAAPSLWGYESNMGENPFFAPTRGNIYHFLGTEASLTFPGMQKVYYADPDKKGWQYPLTTEVLNIQKADPYPRQIEHFCRVILGEEKPRTSGEDGLRTLEVTMALAESGRTGLPVEIQY